uniref:Coiled-coil domain containing 191 n=1 Tax=Anolis carolinensis TaxID=28377 RepID=G1KJH4_ANOCA|nr:PREDICTED: coiled-coil domain-containing protein 191 [Anolis carolinensis]|eukprot:XP_003219254.3 PREDICTED: coiled-coil domain-containing protein 191 [Anolis carolinensis]
MAVLGPRPELYRWRRFSQPLSRQKKKFDADNVDHWIKRVEQASEYAVSEAFSLKKTSCTRGLCGPVLNLETTDQLMDHDEAYAEAQELLSDWMDSKLKLELMSDQEDANGNPIIPIPSQEPIVAFQKYQKFDELYEYLEEELEDTTVQDYLQHLLQSEVVNSGILKDLRTEDLKEKKKTRDPRITMDLRHKQVKENRLRRQKELELLKQERALKKSAMSEAQKQLQEEKKKKALKAKKEEEEIQKQMVKLRKEMVDRRHLMEEAWKMERKRHSLKRTQRLVEFGLFPSVSGHIDCEKEELKKEKQIKIQELLNRVDVANQKCLQKYFSAWYKLILDLRLKMGKARAFADWKCQLKTLRAWRDHVWSQNLEQETQKMEHELRDQNRKNLLATEFNRKCILRHCFTEWQCWSRAEVEKRELQLKKEETRKKMAKLLGELELGKLLPVCSSWDAKRHHEAEGAMDQCVNFTEVAEIPLIQVDPPAENAENTDSYSLVKSQKFDPHSLQKPKWAWQVTLKHAALNTQDHAMFVNPTRNYLQHLGKPKQKSTPIFLGPMEHRYAFQQQLIEEQKRQLQEQQELILKLQENERLKAAREEATRATTATLALDNHVQKIREGKRANFSNREPLRSKKSHPAVQSRKNLKMVSTTHPLLRAMEERAIERAERRKELEEAKRKREEDKLAQMQAEEEERQRVEAAEREAQLEKRREERKLQKIKELENQRRLERDQQLLSKAKEHYDKVLLKKRGFEPWKKLIEQAHKNVLVAQKHRVCRLQRKCLLAWLHHMQEVLAEKIIKAEQLYSSLLLRRYFRIWMQYKDYLSTLEEHARKHHESSLKKKVFGAWFNVFSEEKTALWEKQNIADQYSARRIMLTVFRTWSKFPALMKEEREKEKRREQLRRRVSEILPDFRT